MGASGRSNYVRSFLLIMAVLIALIVCGSALLIYNAFAISIGERKKQFGMFASVGATSAQIRRIVLTEAGVIAAIGIPLGILGAIAGVAILVKLTQGIVSQLILDAEQGLPLVVSPLVIGLTVLFSAATILLSAWIPARRAARVSPIDAIRQSGEIQEGKPLNLRTSPLIRRVFGFEGELALKSLQRDRKKYLTTLLSLMISIILFVAFNALRLYTDTTTRLAVQAMNYDLQIDLDYRQSHANQFADLVSQLPEVQRVSYDRCSHEQYVPPRTVITDPAYQALQELTSLEFENLPSAVEGGTYAFVLKVCAVGPAEFAHYAAQLGLDRAAVFRSIRAAGDPAQPHHPAPGRQAVRFRPAQPEAGRYDDCHSDVWLVRPPSWGRSNAQPDVDGGRGHRGDTPGLYGDGAGSGNDRLGRRLRRFERPDAAVGPDRSRAHDRQER